MAETTLRAKERATGRTVRHAVEEDGHRFVFAPRKRKWGDRYAKGLFDELFEPIDEGAGWEHIHATRPDDAGRAEAFRAFRARWEPKAPNAFTKEADAWGSGLNLDYLGGLSDCRTKPMWFGRGNAWHKEHIQRALDAGEDVSIRAQTSYDVSFETKLADHKAWYSEEYRGCGNGHYYLAVDRSMAVFYEDD